MQGHVGNGFCSQHVVEDFFLYMFYKVIEVIKVIKVVSHQICQSYPQSTLEFLKINGDK